MKRAQIGGTTAMANDRTMPAGLEIRGPMQPAYETVLTPAALEFIADLTRRFGARVAELLAARATLQKRLDEGVLPDFLAETADVRKAQWQVTTIPSDLQDRLNRLNAISRQSASHAGEGVQDFIADTIHSLTGNAVSQLTSGVQERVGEFTDEATRMSNKAIRRVSREIDRRPLLTLAIAAGVGYLAGMAMQPRED